MVWSRVTCWAVSWADRPLVLSMPMATMVSLTKIGLTALMRRPRGSSRAAAVTKDSIAPLTMEMVALPTMGSLASRPLVKVKDPPSRR